MTGCIANQLAAKLGGMPTAVRVGMFDQTIRVCVVGRLLIGGCPILRSRIAKVGGRNRVTDKCTGGYRSVPHP